MATVEEADTEVLDLYGRRAPAAIDVISQQALLEDLRDGRMSWIDLARGVDHLGSPGHLQPVSGLPYGRQLTSSGAGCVGSRR